MKRHHPTHSLTILSALILMTAMCSNEQPPPPPQPASPTAALDAKIRRFAPVDVTAPVASLPPGEAAALSELVAAARLIDQLFLEQVWSGNAALLAALEKDTSAEGRAELHYFRINKGPWSRIDHNEIFVRPQFQVPAKPGQANYYPADATKEEVEKWIATLKGPAHADATGFFTVIRRGNNGRLAAVPYSVEYKTVLAQLAAHLKKAASLTAQPTLKRFLELRADAFLSNDYFASDMAWMELDASIEPTIGPYETYEDEWFGYKAAFEAFITLKDDAETKKLDVFGARLQELENALPIDAALRNPRLGALAPMRVVNVLFSAGDGNRGVQTAAFNLPNDDRVIREKGSKRVMLKNVQEAKFSKVLMPIAAVALSPADRKNVSFDAFFTHILMHELMHGLGPHQVKGTNSAVRLALKDTYAAIEEAKADISGLWALQQLADKGVVSAEVAKTMYTTFLASVFRSIRFGLGEAHGKGIALQINFMIDHGAVVVNRDGTFAIVPDKIRNVVTALTGELMHLQANGDYAAAQAYLKKLVTVRPEVQRVLDKLKDVPVDIEPNFTGAR